MMSKRYAIYGGTFDPVHIGHLSLADAAVRECGLFRLIFMPDNVSPFKQDSKAADASHRYAMLKSILHYNSAFTISDYEILKEGPSYTIETLEFWDNIVNGELLFVMGFDSVIEVENWKRGADILRKYPLITAKRPDTDEKAGMQKIDALRSKYDADITVLKMPPVDASSTIIRERIKSCRDIKGLVPPEVEEYIIEHKLYK